VRLPAIHLCCHGLASLNPQVKSKISEYGTLNLVLSTLEKLESEQDLLTDDNLTFLECCWTFLSNVTDESPHNCEKIIQHNGIKHILQALRRERPQRNNVQRNVMGLLANISEVPSLRSVLMSEGILPHLINCMDKCKELEVTYNATGILCHLLAEGPELWAFHGLGDQMDFMLERLVQTVDSWTNTPESWINYRTMKPIAYLLNPNLPWQILYWAAWAVDSLCAVDPVKYCTMALNEGIAKQLLNFCTHFDPRLREKANHGVERCKAFAAAQNAPKTTTISVSSDSTAAYSAM